MKPFSVLGLALQYTLEVLPILRRTNNLRGVPKSNATWELLYFRNAMHIRRDTSLMLLHTAYVQNATNVGYSAFDNCSHVS
jgi:hypothetical protein